MWTAAWADKICVDTLRVHYEEVDICRLLTRAYSGALLPTSYWQNLAKIRQKVPTLSFWCDMAWSTKKSPVCIFRLGYKIFFESHTVWLSKISFKPFNYPSKSLAFHFCRIILHLNSCSVVGNKVKVLTHIVLLWPESGWHSRRIWANSHHTMQNLEISNFFKFIQDFWKLAVIRFWFYMMPIIISEQ